MNWYLIKIEYPLGLTHGQGQHLHGQRFQELGIRWMNYKWHHGQGNAHFWKMRLTDKELSVLKLAGAVVKQNMTEEWIRSGLSKLSEDEKEALGLDTFGDKFNKLP